MTNLELETGLMKILKEHADTVEVEGKGTVYEINICLFSDIKNYICKILKDNNIEVEYE